MLGPLTEYQAQIIGQIVAHMTRAHLNDYAKYKEGDGHTFSNMEDIEMTIIVHKEGWIDAPQDLFDNNSVYLSREAWNKYSLSEWDDVEEEAIEKLRSEESGSW
tara:strand:+ start:29030 stop:29341 length:312 start_codon:yes stop_codon:yes gene_type:complete